MSVLGVVFVFRVALVSNSAVPPGSPASDISALCCGVQWGPSHSWWGQSVAPDGYMEDGGCSAFLTGARAADVSSLCPRDTSVPASQATLWTGP